MKEVQQNMVMIMVAIVCISIFGLIGIDMFAPSLPLIPKLFNTSVTKAQLTISIFLFGFAGAELIAGTISDRTGRKPVLYTGVGIFCLATLICLTATSIESLLAGRLLQGIGAGSVAVLSRVIFRDFFSGIDLARIGSYLEAVIMLSLTGAPALGGVLQQTYGFHAVFFCLLLVAFVLLIIVFIYLPESNQFKAVQEFSLGRIKKSYQRVLTNKIFMTNVIISGVAFSAIIVTATVNPFLLQNLLHLTPSQYGAWALVGMAGLIVGMFLNGYLVMRYGIAFMMRLGASLILFSGLCFVVGGFFHYVSIAVIIIPTFIISMSASFLLANAVANAFTPFPDIAGTAGAIYGFLQILITSSMSTILSGLDIENQLAMGVLLSVAMLVCLRLLFLSQSKRPCPQCLCSNELSSE